MNDKRKYVYSLRCAGYLMLNGYPILGIEKNLDNPTKNVYVFNYSNSIDKTIEEYKQRFKNKREA